eukprot:CAMPEP_0175827522 /NCGR_PEP_ID=MMETSP0107_2-20121207/12329_1 /TAXON_ID=195067 ORGANISM="Goniomonas pacifica, Strain CCMP1869" /NCGR_SAMPLE_ID=MMETSP0107_2 /ASSEMBLY_ACC=CAM_ASM_000203 /LENGTH=148 /DNA_ID=CAMNT_0017140205 /DNA_START=10 /DNA_END=456 /DNA_ORIENTATION=-
MNAVTGFMLKKKAGNQLESVEKQIFGDKKEKEPPSAVEEAGSGIAARIGVAADDAKARQRIAEKKKEREAKANELRAKYQAERSGGAVAAAPAPAAAESDEPGFGSKFKSFFTETIPRGTKKAGNATKTFFTEDIPKSARKLTSKSDS